MANDTDESSRFKDNGDGTILDTQTNLLWQKDFGPELPWQGAMDYAKENRGNLHGKGWRLPTVKELQSLVDYENGSAELKRFFSGVSRSYWSATTLSDSTTTAWLVYLSYGFTATNGKTDANVVRCVRSPLPQ